MTLRVTLVSERTTMATTSVTSGSNSASDSRLGNTTTSNSGRCCSRAIPLGETGSQTKIFIKKGRSLGQRRAEVKSAKGRKTCPTVPLR